MRLYSESSKRSFDLQCVAALAISVAGCGSAAGGAPVDNRAGAPAIGGGSGTTGGAPGTGGVGGATTPVAGGTSAGGVSEIGGTGGSGDSGAAASGGAVTSFGGTGGAFVGAGGTFVGAGGRAGAGGSAEMGGAVNNPSGPAMGWASWNSFAAKINASVIKAQADAMVSSGLKDAGYQFVNIDEGWWQGTRDANGNITIDTAEWPGGMQAIADYIHGLGLKAGIYTDAGKDGCGYYYPTGRPAAPGSGSEGHYEQDFLQFSKWGFDFVKVDWCGGSKEGLDAKSAYRAIADAIKKASAQTGRAMVLSVCNWGDQNPWNWAPALSAMWRTSQDIIYYGDKADMKRVLSNFDSAQHESAQSPGHYNDPDMLIVGMSAFTLAQNRTHMALWAISGAPLLAGNKLDAMSAEVKGVLTNREVIAINQDPLAKQGTKLSDSGGLQVYNKVLSGTGRRAVLLLNRSASAAQLSVRFADIGLGTSAAVRDVWAGADLGSKDTSYSATVATNDSLLLLVTDPAVQK